ncbi:MAG: hypothetical protein EOO05_20600 [Chitinophagaceae bacterium]|nr:MAG: hypothetical protein EOO05_20600 [Chitinophagaceae bacterium]
MMVVRMSSDNGSINEGKGASEESERKVAANLKELVAYWKKANVRVVTMSWGFFVSDYEGDIKAFHPELSEAEVKARALKLWTMRKDALYKAFSLAPEILFIASNGNKNSDSDNDFRYPAALDLPNMIGVGSVDASGQQTSFTATGSKVKVHANGFQVESFAPGGSKFLMSGTSMATPYIANLAVKLLVVKPTLTALQVRDLIIKGADVSADGKVILANPKKSFELLAAMK